MQKQKERVVYTSLDVQRSFINQQLRQRHKTKKKKQRRIDMNSNLSNAAKIYLREPKLLSSHQISAILNSHIHGDNEASFVFKKLEQEIRRRQSQEGQLKVKKSKNKKSQRYLSNRKSSSNAHQLESHYRQRYGLDESNRERNISHSQQTYNQKNQLANNISSREIIKINTKRRQQIKLQRIQQLHRRSKKKGPNNSLINARKAYLNHQLFYSQKNRVNRLLNPISSPSRRQVQSSPRISDNSLQTIQTKPRLTIRNIKGFVINEKDEQVSKILLDQGWKQFGEQSQKYTLKWTYNNCFKDYQLLRTASKTNTFMYFNHICGNKLTNKDDFNKITQNLRQKGINIAAFIPQTFILSQQYLQFVHSFQVRSIFSGLEKHYKYFEIKHSKNKQLFNKPQPSTDMNFQIRQYIKFLLNLQEQNQNVQDLLRVQNQNEGFLVNITLIYNLLVLCANFWICQQGQESQLFDLKFRHLCADHDVISKLISLNKADLLFQQYHEFKCTIKKRKQLKQKRKQLCIINGYLKSIKTFMTPSQKIIKGVYLFHQYFNYCVSKKLLGGLKNLWIIKPCNGSKGCGIQIIDRIQKITPFSQANSNKIVQKYIENIWVLRNQEVEKFNLNYQEVKNFINRKFDIRQWVLLKPPHSFMFSSFYLRICSKQYGFQSLNDHCIHLSNFTINKDNFNKLQQSVMSQKQFKKILESIGRAHNYNNMKTKIKQRIKLLTNQAIMECQVIPGTFEIIGFDILIDQQFNPWIIQCNMSPACNLRTEWLKQMKHDMTTGALKIVLQKDLLTIDQTKCDDSQYKWEILSRVHNLSQKQVISQQMLEINGEKMKINKSISVNQKKGQANPLG